MNYIFVYGSLKIGYFSHRILSPKDTLVRQEAYTTPEYKLYELANGLPVMVEAKEGGLRIQGELYLISGETLDRLDLYERGAGYERLPIKVEQFHSPVESYLYQLPFGGATDCGHVWLPSWMRKILEEEENGCNRPQEKNHSSDSETGADSTKNAGAKH